MSLVNSDKYGHISRDKTAGSAWRWLVIALILVWCLIVCVFNAERVAALTDYHPAVGEPLTSVGGYRLYAPWKLVQWNSRFQHNEEVTKIIDQTYLLAVGVPILLFLVHITSQQGLKGRDDLHGSARWAERKDVEKMGYLKSQGVYVGGWWDSKKKIHYYLRHNGPEHVLCFAPTRSGKGIGLILPTLLAWEHSSLVLDIKGENFVRP